jgi:predicted nucleic-acid-binding Zn-ribbon protein
MALSAQDITRINAALDKAKASKKCLSCGSRNIPLNPEMLGLPTAQHGMKVGAVPTGKVQMCVARVCKRCGYTMLYSVVALGLDSMM